MGFHEMASSLASNTFTVADIRAPSGPTYDATRLVSVVDMPQNVRRWYIGEQQQKRVIIVRKLSFSVTYMATEHR